VKLIYKIAWLFDVSDWKRIIQNDEIICTVGLSKYKRVDVSPTDKHIMVSCIITGIMVA